MFRIAQDDIDRLLLERIVSRLGLGRIITFSRSNELGIYVADSPSLSNIIIPFFKKFPLFGDKL
jgi:hypothetical protein